MDTILDVTQLKYPKIYQGRKITANEGKSFKSIFYGKKRKDYPIFIEHAGSSAVRNGDWKLVSKSEIKRWELYNMSKR